MRLIEGRRPIGTGAAAVALVLAAGCSPTEVTGRPIDAPFVPSEASASAPRTPGRATERPTPSVVFTPTPSERPTPTPEVTPETPFNDSVDALRAEVTGFFNYRFGNAAPYDTYIRERNMLLISSGTGDAPNGGKEHRLYAVAVTERDPADSDSKDTFTVGKYTGRTPYLATPYHSYTLERAVDGSITVTRTVVDDRTQTGIPEEISTRPDPGEPPLDPEELNTALACMNQLLDEAKAAQYGQPYGR